MSFLKSLFGQEEDQIRDNWRKLRKINDVEQLVHICVQRYTQPLGALAFLRLTSIAPNKAEELMRNDEYGSSPRYNVHSLKRLNNLDAILISTGSEFNEIRDLLKKVKDLGWIKDR